MINAMGTPACTFKQLWDNVADTKLTIVMWCRILIRSTQRHLAAVSAGGINSQATCVPVLAIPARLGPHSN